MAEPHKKEEQKPKASDKPKAEGHETKTGHAHEKPAQGHEHKAGETHAHEKAAPKKGAKKAEGAKPAAKAGAKKPEKKEPVKIVEKPSAPKYAAAAKPTLSAEQKKGLALRRSIAGRRPHFRRQQWYEYKRLANSGWRKPTGVDSAMRRHFGYEQPVVRIGFAGPKSVRGLHPSGFQEVYVTTATDLERIDPKTQAARVSGTLGARKLKLLYAEADKRGVRILNRRQLE